METESVTTRRVGAAAVVTIARPEVRNALRPEDARDLTGAIARAEADESCLGIVLTGEGAFCAGADLVAIMAMVEGASQDQVAERIYSDFQGMARALRDCRVPTVAVVDGYAIGLGLDLALWCDSRVLSERARLGQGWAALGLIPGTGGADLLQQVGPGSLWSMLGAKPLKTAEAVALGLGRGSDDPMGETVAMVQGWEGVGRAALEGYATLARRRLPDDDYLALCAQTQASLLLSPRFRDTALAILKR
jgi:enoyl-CoA hydratase